MTRSTGATARTQARRRRARASERRRAIEEALRGRPPATASGSRTTAARSYHGDPSDEDVAGIDPEGVALGHGAEEEPLELADVCGVFVAHQRVDEREAEARLTSRLGVVEEAAREVLVVVRRAAEEVPREERNVFATLVQPGHGDPRRKAGEDVVGDVVEAAAR